jgi:hypothetical protein
MAACADDVVSSQRDTKRVTNAAAGLLAAVSGAGAGAAMAGIVTVTTTQQYGPTPLSYDVLFTPVENATDLVSISDGSVYTGEGPSFTIQAIGTDDTTVDLFFEPIIYDFFQTKPLVDITSNTFTDFSPRDIKGLRFTFVQPNPGPQPSLTLTIGTEFQFAVVPEPSAGVLLGCGLAAVLIGRRVTKFLSTAPAR